MTPWTERLRANTLLIADGAWGTELVRRGLSAGDVPEHWIVERPDAVRAVAASYVEAGADIILTNSFGGSRIKLEKCGWGERVAEVNRAAARLSKSAAGDRALVFASVGPTGEFMEPLGALSEEAMTDCFAEQIAALAEGGADGIVIESMADLNEARAALRAAKRAARLPVVVSMTFEKGARGCATMMGVSPEDAARTLTDDGADAVGANCCAGIDVVIAVTRAMRPVTALPLWMKPNAGLPELSQGRTVYRETPEEFVRRVPELIAAGARIVGGCCGTTPEHIRQLAEFRTRATRADGSERLTL